MQSAVHPLGTGILQQGAAAEAKLFTIIHHGLPERCMLSVAYAKGTGILQRGAAAEAKLFTITHHGAAERRGALHHSRGAGVLQRGAAAEAMAKMTTARASKMATATLHTRAHTWQRVHVLVSNDSRRALYK
eukprot:1159922-Pelagomonas_calceolata.AAC.3